MLSKNLRASLAQLYRSACENGYEYIGVDQLMLELLKHEDVRKLLQAHNINLDHLNQLLVYYVDSLTPRIPLARKDWYPKLTADLRQILAYTFRLYSIKGRKRVNGAQLIPPILVYRRTMATLSLSRMGLGLKQLKHPDSELVQSQIDALASDSGSRHAALDQPASGGDGEFDRKGISNESISLNESDELNELDELNEINEINELNEFDELNEANEFDELDEANELDEFDDPQANDDGDAVTASDPASNDGKTRRIRVETDSQDGDAAFYVEVMEEDGNSNAAFSEPMTTASMEGDELLTTVDADSYADSSGRTIIGRDNEILSVARILLRKNKNNVLLTGEAGVGKTTLIRHLVCSSGVDTQRMDATMQQFRWHQLNTSRLLAGMRYQGNLEREFGRLRGGDNLSPVLIIDDLGELIGSGAHNRGGEDVVRLLLNAIDQPGLRVIGACNYKEFHGLLEHHPSLMRRFQTVDIDEPSRENTQHILEKLRPEYEVYHQVSYSSEVLAHIIACADRFDLNRYFPDKAVDIMDEVGSYVRLRSGNSHPITIDNELVESVARQRARIDVGQNTSIDPIRDLHQHLSKQIFNQDKAIEELVKTLKISFSDLHDSARMRGCFLFVGPTGVGKTELTRQLAAALNMPLHRYDMSEFSERHSASRLIGAPPGYVGFEDGGQLVSDVRKAPHSVILLDELEKAHTDVLNLMLQMMDYGTLTSSSGIKTRFHHCVLVATTNVGATEVARNKPGFIESGNDAEYKQQVSKSFSPEFINRFDSIVYFNSLREADLEPMVRKLIEELNKGLADKKLRLECEENAVKWLCRHAFDSKLGARPLARMFREMVKLPVANYLSESVACPGGVIGLTLEQDQLRFSWPEPGASLKSGAKRADPPPERS